MRHALNSSILTASDAPYATSLPPPMLYSGGYRIFPGEGGTELTKISEEISV